MCVSIPHMFCVRVDGTHPSFITKNYYGLSFGMTEAMQRARDRAGMDGWFNIHIEQIIDYGEIEFGFNSKDTEEEPCNP